MLQWFPFLYTGIVPITTRGGQTGCGAAFANKLIPMRTKAIGMNAAAFASLFKCLPDAHKAIGMNAAAFASLFKFRIPNSNLQQ